MLSGYSIYASMLDIRNIAICGSDSKESACNVGDSSSIPGWGISPWSVC